MQGKVNKAKRLSHMKEFNSSLLIETPHNPYVLNIKLTSNPFLRDQQPFQYIVYQLNQYNKRVLNKQVKDEYEAMSFQRLHSMVSDLAQIDTREDQVARLEEVFKWFKNQERVIQQRIDQGEVRYKMTKDVRNGVEVIEKEKVQTPKTHKDEIPTNRINRQSLPFKKNWRTAHKELQIPPVRLEEYKRKVLNIVPFDDHHKDEKKAPRILYPKIEKLEEPKQEEEEVVQEGNQQVVQQNIQNPQGQPQVPKEVEEQQQNLDFGEPPEQPQEDDEPEEEVKDKLAPRFKPYTKEEGDISRKNYKEAYLFFRGQDLPIQRRMEERYIRKQHDFLQKQKNDSIGVEMVHEWGTSRNKIQKQLQKKLQLKSFRPRYSYSEEEPPAIERINPKDQMKYGFSVDLRVKAKPQAEVDVSEFQLPKIHDPYHQEKQIRKKKLKSLKNQFKKMLNLTDVDVRQNYQSLCQQNPRKRGISEVLKDHSKSKQRLQQLDQVSLIKQKLARTKVGIDIKSLSMGMCCPQDEEKVPEKIFAQKELPKNPFWVQPTKKKKKK